MSAVTSIVFASYLAFHAMHHLSFAVTPLRRDATEEAQSVERQSRGLDDSHLAGPDWTGDLAQDRLAVVRFRRQLSHGFPRLRLVAASASGTIRHTDAICSCDIRTVIPSFAG